MLIVVHSAKLGFGWCQRRGKIIIFLTPLRKSAESSLTKSRYLRSPIPILSQFVCVCFALLRFASPLPLQSCAVNVISPRACALKFPVPHSFTFWGNLKEKKVLIPGYKFNLSIILKEFCYRQYILYNTLIIYIYL